MQNSSNQKYANNADGWELAGGSTPRKLTVTGADIGITGSGTNVYTFPAGADTLVGRVSTDTLTNKTLTAPVINAATIGTSLVPTSNDGAALGSSTLMFSDLFLAPGGVVNFNNGNATLTQSPGLLTSNVAIAGPVNAYDATTWNGSAKFATEDAVRDKIEALSSGSAILKQYETKPVGSGALTLGSISMSATNTTMTLGLVNIPSQITVDNISSEVSSHAVNGTMDISIYSEDGQTRYISVTSPTITGTGVVTIAAGGVVLAAGNYYFAVNVNSTTDIAIRSVGISATALRNVSGQGVTTGTLTITAGTPPATITPSSITVGSTVPLLSLFDS